MLISGGTGVNFEPISQIDLKSEKTGNRLRYALSDKRSTAWVYKPFELLVTKNDIVAAYNLSTKEMRNLATIGMVIHLVVDGDDQSWEYEFAEWIKAYKESHKA